MDWTRKLRRAGVAMQDAAAEACTMAARLVADRYRTRIRTQTIMMRNEKFTLRAITVYPARGVKKGGELRPMTGINAVVGVRKIGDREHYLAMLEVGADKRNPEGVAIPVDSARGGVRRNPVIGAMRLKGGGYGTVIDLTRLASNPRQQFAVMNSMARRGKLAGGRYYAVDHGTKKWLYKVVGKRAMIVRDISEEIVKIKANPMFEESVREVTSGDMETYFMRAAMILLGSLE